MLWKPLLAVAFGVALTGMVGAEETGAAPTGKGETSPAADDTREHPPLPVTGKPLDKWLPYQIKGVFQKTFDPVVLFERPEQIDDAAFIRGEAGETRPIKVGALMQEGDTILTGKAHQVFGRFGDGPAVYMTPFTVIRLKERGPTAEGGINTLLEMYQGALRVNTSQLSSKGVFTTRIPNVKEGPISITGNRAHYFIFPDPRTWNTEWQTIDLLLHVWSGECKVELPLTKQATGDIMVTMDRGTTVTVPMGMALRMTFRYEAVEDPKFGSWVYWLFLDVFKVEEIPLGIEQSRFEIPPPPPPFSDGGK